MDDDMIRTQFMPRADDPPYAVFQPPPAESGADRYARQIRDMMVICLCIGMSVLLITSVAAIIILHDIQVVLPLKAHQLLQCYAIRKGKC